MLIALLHVASVLTLRGGTMLDFAWFCLGSVGLVALFGYISQRALISRHVWVVYFLLSAGWLLVSFVKSGVPSVDFAVALALLMGVPAYWAAFAYAFRSEHLWARSAQAGI